MILQTERLIYQCIKERHDTFKISGLFSCHTFHWLTRRQIVLIAIGFIISIFKICVGILSWWLFCGLWLPLLVPNALDWVELWMWLNILLPLSLSNLFQHSTTVLILLQRSIHCIPSQAGIFFIEKYFKIPQKVLMTTVFHSCPQRKKDFWKTFL